MSKSDLAIAIALSVWVVVAAIVAGVLREKDGKWDGDSIGPAVCWPLFAVFVVPMWMGWMLAWLGRGPAILIRRLKQRARLPRAVARAKERP